MYKSMATKKRGLGQGIDSLIPNKVNANKETETVKVNAGSEKMRQMESLLISIKWNQTENSLEKTLMRIHWWIYQNPLSRWECFSRYLYWIKRIIMKLLLGNDVGEPQNLRD